MFKNKDKDIAILGMAARVPGANTIDEFWSNLVDGIESIADIDSVTLERAGVSAAKYGKSTYVARSPILASYDQFDARFFGFTDTEATLVDPQQRLLLEVCRDALEDAGLIEHAKSMRTGVYATGGGVVSSYLVNELHSLCGDGEFTTGGMLHLGNDKDFLATRVAFKLDLRGPSMTVQSACSSSFAALKVAMQALLLEEIDLAVVGGACVRVPHLVGYDYEKDPVQSKDGHCRPFDHRASGTLFGSGAAAIVLKRSRPAQEDNDNVYATIRACCLNNDGGNKVTYTASSVPSQIAAMREAVEAAGINACDVTYIEAHGTATKIGDPLEMKALQSAFSEAATRQKLCGVGSVKSNIGHLEQVAGLASIIKVALMLKRKMLIPSLHYEAPNPKLSLSEKFYIVSKVSTWEASDQSPRLAGINCLGMGGTNAFAILEEAKPRAGDSNSSKFHLFVLSTKTLPALNEHACKFVEYLKVDPHVNLTDLSYTMAVGRTLFPYRYVCLASCVQELITGLSQSVERETPPLVQWSDVTYRSYPLNTLPAITVGRSLHIWRHLRRRYVNVLYQMYASFRRTVSLTQNVLMLDKSVKRIFRRVAAEATYLWGLAQLGVQFDRVESAGLGAYAFRLREDEPDRVVLDNLARFILGFVLAQKSFSFYRIDSDGFRRIPHDKGISDRVRCENNNYFLAIPLSLEIAFKDICHACDISFTKVHVPFEGYDTLVHRDQCSSSTRESPFLEWVSDPHSIQFPIDETSQKTSKEMSSMVSICLDTLMIEHVAVLLNKGAKLSLAKLLQGSNAAKISAPTYPYQRQHYWIKQRKETLHE